jgi:hypothetical protein
MGPIWEAGTSGRREDEGKECRRVSMVQILCTHVSGKMKPVETIPGIGEER